MKSLWKKLGCSLVSISLLASLGACAQDTPAPAQPDQSDASASASSDSSPAEGAESLGEESPEEAPAGDIAGDISWLMRSNPFENEWEQDTVIPQFEAMYPDVSVNMIIVPQEQVDPKLLSMQAAGTPPDIFSMWGDSGFMDYYNKGLLLELTDYIARDIDQNDFIDGIFEIYAVDGRYFHMPQVSNFSIMMVYNKDLFREAGLPDLPSTWNDPDWTWDTMVDYARQLTKGSGADKQYGVYFDTTAPHHVVYQFGADPFPAEAYATGVMDATNYDDPAVVEVLQKWADLIHVEEVHPTPAAKELLEQMGHIFKTGKIGMATILPTQAYGNFNDADFEWGLAPLPAGTPGNATGILYNGAYFIAKDSKAPDAAWELIKYLSTPQAAEEMREITGFLVPLKETSESWFQQMADATGVTVEEMKEAVTGYPKDRSLENINHTLSGYPELMSIYKQGLDTLWLGNVTAEEAVQGFIGKLNETAARIKADNA